MVGNFDGMAGYVSNATALPFFKILELGADVGTYLNVASCCCNFWPGFQLSRKPCSPYNPTDHSNDHINKNIISSSLLSNTYSIAIPQHTCDKTASYKPIHSVEYAP